MKWNIFEFSKVCFKKYQERFLIYYFDEELGKKTFLMNIPENLYGISIPYIPWVAGRGWCQKFTKEEGIKIKEYIKMRYFYLSPINLELEKVEE